MKKNIHIFSFILLFLFLFVGFNTSTDVKKITNVNENTYGKVLSHDRNWSDYTSDELEKIVESDIELTIEELDDIIILIKSRANHNYFSEIVNMSSTKDKSKNAVEEELPSGFNTVKKEVITSSSEYFGNANLGLYEYNLDGTCSYVSLALLMGYYNQEIEKVYKNPRGALIPETVYSNRENKSIRTLKQSQTNPDIYIPSKEYHDYIYKDVGLDKLKKSHWMSQQGTAQTMDYLIENNSEYHKTKEINPKYATVFGSIKSHIDKGRPVIGTFLKYKYYVPDKGKYYNSVSMSNAHSVVIYGYRETNAGLYYLCHMGWGGQEYTNVWITSAGLGRYGYAFIDVNDKNMKKI